MPSPPAARRTLPCIAIGASPMAMAMVPVRDPSADARLQMSVSVTRSFGPIIDFAKSGNSSVEITRLVTISVCSPLAVTDSVWDSGCVASTLAAWKAGSASMTNTSSGVAA